MNTQENLVELASSREVFCKLFMLSHGLTEPVLRLDRLMHWQAVKSTFNVETPNLDAAKTLVCGGYFYGFSTPALQNEEIENVLSMGRHYKVEQYLVPTVRDDVENSVLISAGFTRIPWFVESTFDIESTVDCDLMRRLGNKDFRELKRLTTRVQKSYRWDWYKASDLACDVRLIETVANLHEQNTLKYGHTVNLYPALVIENLANSPLGEHLLIGLRFEIETGKAVQAVICLEDTKRADLFVLVHGRDYSHDSKGQNFYNTLFYELYQLAERRMLRTIYLGRGNHKLKKKLGANRFRVLSNWVLVNDSESRRQLDSICKAASQKLDLNIPKLPDDFLHPLARRVVSKVSRPLFLDQRQQLEKAGYLDLASNIGARASKFSRYPDLDHVSLKEKYIGFLNLECKEKSVGHTLCPLELSSDHVYFTRGITEGIDLLIRAFCEPGVDRVFIPIPTFSMYEYWARAFGVDVTKIRLESYLESYDDSASLVRPEMNGKYKLTFLCNPNNPLGTALPIKAIAQYASQAKGFIVVDEAYGEFSQHQSCASLIASYPNIIVLRTFSKAWSMAGLRCGVVIANPKVIAALRLIQGPFGFPSVVQEEIDRRLSSPSVLFEEVTTLRNERKRMASLLACTPGVTQVYPSEANFLCVEFSDVKSIMDRLHCMKIIAEQAAHPLLNCLRIAVSTREENQRLLEALASQLRR